jgi:6-phosphofructokinase 1
MEISSTKEIKMPAQKTKRLAVLTSGGDAQGMNAALRSIVRTALSRDIEVFAVYEGYQGLIEGGSRIQKMNWSSVGGILQRGGTAIGTARSAAFQTREGRLVAAKNLLEHDIDSLVVIGGDGSLTGASIFREEWPSLLAELVEKKEISSDTAKFHPYLVIVGLVGSIDNDMYGTDMTIGADSALHRITEAVDAIASTAASHQRTFVVKVMGRNCGYLAVMAALATGADWVLIPESPPDVDNWQEVMCERLQAGRRAGRRDSIVILAEGAHDRHGKYIGSSDVQKVLEDTLGEDVRVTVLGHVQRGGAPSAFDRNLGTQLGYAAVEQIMEAKPEDEPVIIGLKGNRITNLPLMHCVEKTHEIAKAIEVKDYEKALSLRTSSFREAFRTLRTFVRALPHTPESGMRRLRLAIMNVGAPAPGMNTATRSAVRLGIDRGHILLGIHNGFEGLADGEIEEMNWMSVNGWASMGGSELGTSRKVPEGSDLYAVARNLEKYEIEGLMLVGGWAAYETVHKLMEERKNFPAFNIPMVCLPATINNNLPMSELSVGADTALNSIVEAVDKIKQSAMASRRCFVVEVMGHYCGYLALLGAMATGAERVYIHEEGVTLKNLADDVEMLKNGFLSGKRLGLIIRNEYSNPIYTTPFTSAVYEEEGQDIFDVRQAILGHQQQGGNPSPFDRIMAIRLADRCINYLIEKAMIKDQQCASIGLWEGNIGFMNMEDFTRNIDLQFQRPKNQWWISLIPIAKSLI